MNLPCGGKLPLTKLCFKPTLLHFSSDEITGHNQHIPVTDLPPPLFFLALPSSFLPRFTFAHLGHRGSNLVSRISQGRMEISFRGEAGLLC